MPKTSVANISSPDRARWRAASDTTLERELTFATLVSGLAVLVGGRAEQWLQFDDLSLVFMTAVIAVAVRARMGVAVYAAVLCFLEYNFFFIEPRFSFFISARHGIATVSLFLIAALACGRLANRLRSQVLLVEAARIRAEARRELGRQLAAADGEPAIRAAASAALRDAFEGEAAVFLADPVGLKEADVDASHRMDASLMEAVTRCWANAAPDRNDAVTDASGSWTCWPLAASGQKLGVLALRLPAGESLSPEGAALGEAVSADLAQALVRLRLKLALGDARLQA